LTKAGTEKNNRSSMNREGRRKHATNKGAGIKKLRAKYKLTA
jgi:hypothetical protein